MYMPRLGPPVVWVLGWQGITSDASGECEAGTESWIWIEGWRLAPR